MKVLFLENLNDYVIMEFRLLDNQNSYLGLILPGMVASQEEGKSHSQTRQLFPSPLMAFHQLFSWISLGHNQQAAFSTERLVFLKHSIIHPLSLTINEQSHTQHPLICKCSTRLLSS